MDTISAVEDKYCVYLAIHVISTMGDSISAFGDVQYCVYSAINVISTMGDSISAFWDVQYYERTLISALWEDTILWRETASTLGIISTILVASLDNTNDILHSTDGIVS